MESTTVHNAKKPLNRFLDIRVDPITRMDAVDWAGSCIADAKVGNYIIVLNVAKLVEARKNPSVRQIIDGADLVGADGVPIVWLSRFIGARIPERVCGTDLMMDLLEEGNRNGWSFFFFGATQEVVEQFAAKTKFLYPNLVIAGFRNGYFFQEEERKIVEEINSSGANILFIAFGSPKKEFFVDRWRKELHVNVIHGVGGSFDVFVGRVKRAPVFMQRLGLEWFYRFLQEPRRMFKRYAVTNLVFLGLVVAELTRKALGLAGVDTHADEH